MAQPTPYLTKTDFRLARSCPAKLYYHKMGYPQTGDGDDYAAHLAREGYRIEALARALFREGQTIGYSQGVEAAVWETMNAMQRAQATLFEATFLGRGLLARVDILIKRDQRIELIEVKSKALDRADNDARLRDGQPSLFRAGRKGDAIASSWRADLEDVAFQVAVLRELFPGFDIVASLLLPDKSQTSAIEHLHRQFDEQRVDERDSRQIRRQAAFRGDPALLRRSLFLARVDVQAEVDMLIDEVRDAAVTFLGSVSPTLVRIEAPLNTGCRDCEFRVDDDPSGFRTCWEALADVQPSLLDLYKVGTLRGRGLSSNDLIARGKVSLRDLPLDALASKDKPPGPDMQRRIIQIRHTLEDSEWIGEEMAGSLSELKWPLYFVDFETCAPAIPRYAGMRPYETIAFQWSCHILRSPGAEPQHVEWIQQVDAFPNFQFAQALRQQLGETGSTLVWATHERNVLRSIRQQMRNHSVANEELEQWLSGIVDGDRLVDLNSLALRNYFHPRMRGSTSLKVVVDAIWQSNPDIRRRWPQYLPIDGDAGISPYQVLPPAVIDGREVAIVNGSGAILGYFGMMECLAGNDQSGYDAWQSLLKRYCKLDTLAMVMVWQHWSSRAG